NSTTSTASCSSIVSARSSATRTSGGSRRCSATAWRSTSCHRGRPSDRGAAPRTSSTMRYRVVFFGTPEFASASLQAVLAGPDEVVGVVCQPDKPSGRGQQLQAPPVKRLAAEHGVPVVQPIKLKTDELPATLRAWAPDIGVVAAYGRILPPAVLALPRLGCINVHASLLPKYRGAAPIQWALLRGETVTGVTIMYMNERMDEGEMLLQRATAIEPGETYGALQQRLAVLGAAALMDALAALHA